MHGSEEYDISWRRKKEFRRKQHLLEEDDWVFF